MRAGMQKQTEHLELMKNIKSFEKLPEDILSKIADTLDEVSYADGEYIVRQGAKGDTFYIVSKGKTRTVLFLFSNIIEIMIRTSSNN
jgi:cGMP-dependent protein kinase